MESKEATKYLRSRFPISKRQELVLKFMEFIFNLWMGVTAKDRVFVGFGKSGGYCAQSTACCYNAATHSDDRREVTFEFNICHDTTNCTDDCC